MQLTGTENPNLWDKEIDIILTVRELQIIRDCIAKNNYTNIINYYNMMFNTEPPYKNYDMLKLYNQTQKILTNEGGYTI